MERVGRDLIEEALRRVGELLLATGDTHAVVVLGGAALNLLDIVERTTRDVDVIAFGVIAGDGPPADVIPPTEPLPTMLQRAIETVARDMALPSDWMNTGPALQWRQGLPAGLAGRVRWRSYGAPDRGGGLWVGLVDRYDLVFFKLYAAADSSGPSSVHYQDLLALGPTGEELDAAAAWVQAQDATTAFHDILAQVVARARRDLGLTAAGADDT